jgi:predicted HD superfamily hydrolase involved in NAD metabolism
VDPVIFSFLQDNLSMKRFSHSLGTARCAERLCRDFSLDPELGYFAGLVHDIARELPKEEIVALARLSGARLSDWELARPVLLHGRAGAVLLHRKFSIMHPDILSAVRFHTTGRMHMGDLEKVVFIADYIEPGRTFLSEGFRERLSGLSLDGMILLILRDLFGYMKRDCRKVAPPSRILYKALSAQKVM